MDKHLIHPYSGVLLNREQTTDLIHAGILINVMWTVLSYRSQNPKVHTVWFHLYDIPETARLGTESTSVIGMGREEGLTPNGFGRFGEKSD